MNHFRYRGALVLLACFSVGGAGPSVEMPRVQEFNLAAVVIHSDRMAEGSVVSGYKSKSHNWLRISPSLGV